MNFLKRKLESFWAQEVSLAVLLIVLAVHIFIIIPLGQVTTFGRTIFLVFYFFLLVAGLVVLLKNTKLRAIALVLLVVLTIAKLFQSDTVKVVDDLVTALYCMLLGWVVLLRTFKNGPITSYRVLGAIVVYLLVAFIFALLFHAVYLLAGPDTFKGLSTGDKKEFMYFSFVTLTSTGYGDICAALPFVRSLANLEGLIGQLYPAIIIARLVSMEFESSRAKKQNSDPQT